ncbi:LysM peptidoglycan-binding domain-containing protein [Tabrizicola oligotrophica]|uniref:LysM peptidoglycan-binding domain-containing protein n=1 Tax=Tabrizicola oligotrophica TaxID=2710650 RepID=A0A6M0QNZ3_9RHOB|nr:LysM peptidoglycan-binding domain-containing protein [Tabrizicola oligotrophica]NEY89190.1 LysM peptidoglycan-binding domain-containing protein [Tabrizicola oligotrophica]
MARNGAENGAESRTKVWALGGAAGALVLALGVIWWLGQSDPGTAPQEAAPAEASAPVTAPAAPDTALPPEPPRFDVVRVDTAGLATVAGMAPAGAAVSIRLDGVEAATASADAAGQFATLLTLPPSDQPRLMSLIATLPDGTEIAGRETVAIGPVLAPPAALPEAVVAEEAPAALLLGEAGVTVLQQAKAADLLPLSIDSIAYGAGGEVALSGRASPGATLRLYLDDAPLIEAQAGPDGRWTADLAEVAPGLHALRADQLAADGTVAARFETPFQRDLPTAPPPEPAPAAAAPDPAPAVAPAPITTTVQPGFTLWAIARENFGEGMMYVQVFEANRDKIKDPDLIYPGQVFTVPKP